ncbi:hypothetical protein U27_03518 [Candidatus Vecturithrix granuli]|uniref:Uncharacterized protein n=1 Tax=Vecturithrix granuli TaxID=1499967 RepID=A0A081BW51_VECG1|nr:hypothetical protein U27_03518 [Candidatus Vecturithrix granuli]
MLSHIVNEHFKQMNNLHSWSAIPASFACTCVWLLDDLEKYTQIGKQAQQFIESYAGAADYGFVVPASGGKLVKTRTTNLSFEFW